MLCVINSDMAVIFFSGEKIGCSRAIFREKKIGCSRACSRAIFSGEKIGCSRSCSRAIFSGEKIEMFFFIFIISSAAALQRTQQWHNSPRIDRLTVEIPWKTE